MNKLNQLSEAQLNLTTATNGNNDNTNENGGRAQGHATPSEYVHLWRSTSSAHCDIGDNAGKQQREEQQQEQQQQQQQTTTTAIPTKHNGRDQMNSVA